MPIFESSEVTRRKLHELRKHNVCAICGGWLNRFQGESGKLFVACAEWPRSHHEGIVRSYEEKERTIEARRSSR